MIFSSYFKLISSIRSYKIENCLLGIVNKQPGRLLIEDIKINENTEYDFPYFIFLSLIFNFVVDNIVMLGSFIPNLRRLNNTNIT